MIIKDIGSSPVLELAPEDTFEFSYQGKTVVVHTTPGGTIHFYSTIGSLFKMGKDDFRVACVDRTSEET